MIVSINPLRRLGKFTFCYIVHVYRISPRKRLSLNQFYNLSTFAYIDEFDLSELLPNSKIEINSCVNTEHLGIFGWPNAASHLTAARHLIHRRTHTVENHLTAESAPSLLHERIHWKN